MTKRRWSRGKRVSVYGGTARMLTEPEIVEWVAAVNRARNQRVRPMLRVVK